MSCKRSYIFSTIKDVQEAERLNSLHNQIGNEAKKSKLFREEQGKLMLLKNKIKEGFKFIADTNEKYGAKVVKLVKTGNFRFKLEANTLPLSKTGTQINLMFELGNNIEYQLKAVNILNSPKADEIFRKGDKNNWSLDKMLQELQVPKEQQELIKSFNTRNRADIITSLLANYSYTVEINTAKNLPQGKDYSSYTTPEGVQYVKVSEDDYRKRTLDSDFEKISKKEFEDNQGTNTQYYSNLTVPGGTNYTENEISTPLITPSIKGHAQFSTDNGIGWFRSDDRQNQWVPNKDDENKVLSEGSDDDFIYNGDKYLTISNGWELDTHTKNGVKISSKEYFEAYDKLVKNNIITAKTRRILELQSDLFQKGRDRNDLATKDYGLDPDFYRENFDSVEEMKEYEKTAMMNENSSRENQFLQLLNKDSNWVTFFIKSIIQDSAKKGYEKVLFPSGNTASKVEGHTTLEEFKKQKEDRLKVLEEEIKNTPSFTDVREIFYYSWEMGGDGEFQEPTQEQVDNYVKSTKEKYILEKEQLKQELQRVETEGFGALKPIYNFYENQVKNILKKNYNVKEVTDEYGNTWNEVELSKEEVRKAILLQKEEPTKQKPIKELNDKLTQLLNKIGWSVTSIDAYKEWYKQEYGVSDNSPELIKGLADLTNKIIAVSQDREAITTLPEEASHAILSGMINSDLYKKLAELVVNEPMYKEVFKQYINVYKGDINKVKFEALGKILRDSIIKQYPNTIVEQKSLITGLKKLIEKFLNLFKRDKSLTEEIDNLAKEILSGNVSMVDETIQEGNFFELDSEKYKASNDLDDFKSKLDEVIKKRITRLKIYENKGVGDYSKEEKERVDKLLKLYVNDKITSGLVEFINDIDKDTEATWKRLNKVIKENDTIGTAKVLRELKSYVIPFNRTLKDIKKELNSRGDVKYKEITDELVRITSKLDDIELLYEDKSISLVSNYLFPFAENNSEIKSPEDLVKKLKQEEDISFMSRFLDSMAETTDDILGLFDRSVKEAKEKARISAYNKQRDLLAIDKELKDKGENTEFVYERDKNGKITGNYVTEFNRHEFKLARQKAYEDIKSEIKTKYNIDLSDVQEERELQFVKIKGLKRAYNALWRNWIKNNTQANPKAAELVEQKKKYFQDIYGDDKFKGEARWEVAFNTWFADNVTVQFDMYTGDSNVYYKGELTLPANKYRNPQYAEIQADKLKKKYYNKTIALKEDLDRFLPQNIIDPYLAPQLRKDWLERAKNDPKAFVKETLNDLKLRETDTEFGDLRKLTDVDNKPVNFLPLYFTRKIQNSEDLSLDATATMSAYIGMAEDYKEMNKVIHILELGEEVLSKRNVITGESALNKIFGKAGLSGSKAYEQTTGGKAYERYKDYMDMVVFGKMKANEDWMNFAGYNTVKMVDTFNKYTSVVGLAGNIYSAVNNVVLGNALARQEAFAREFIGKGGLTFADKTYVSELPQMLDSIGNPYSDSKLLLVGDLMDVLQDFKSKDLNTDRSRAGKLFSSNSLYALNSIGEHQIQWRTALAIMDNTKVKTKSGEEINLWEALEVRDNKAQLREDVVDFTMDDVIATSIRIKALNQKLHGIYTDSDRSAIQKWTLGRMALVFRKWIKPGINRRFDPKRYDYSLDKHVEGMYRTTGHFLNQVRKDFKSYQAIWNKLEDYEKANVKRSALEFAYLVAAGVLASILSNLAADDDDNWALNFAAYEVNRLYTDLSFFINPKSVIQVVRSPMAGVRTIQQALNLADITNSITLNPLSEDEFLSIKRYKGGPNKGKSKGYVAAKRMIPVIGNIERLLTPEEQLKFFTSPMLSN